MQYLGRKETNGRNDEEAAGAGKEWNREINAVGANGRSGALLEPINCNHTRRIGHCVALFVY